jgi:hypothetical protein
MPNKYTGIPDVYLPGMVAVLRRMAVLSALSHT